MAWCDQDESWLSTDAGPKSQLASSRTTNAQCAHYDRKSNPWRYHCLRRREIYYIDMLYYSTYLLEAGIGSFTFRSVARAAAVSAAAAADNCHLNPIGLASGTDKTGSVLSVLQECPAAADRLKKRWMSYNSLAHRFATHPLIHWRKSSHKRGAAPANCHEASKTRLADKASFGICLSRYRLHTLSMVYKRHL